MTKRTSRTAAADQVGISEALKDALSSDDEQAQLVGQGDDAQGGSGEQAGRTDQSQSGNVAEASNAGKPARNAEPATEKVPARILRDCWLGRVGTVVMLDAHTAKAAREDGAVDLHPTAVREIKDAVPDA